MAQGALWLCRVVLLRKRPDPGETAAIRRTLLRESGRMPAVCRVAVGELVFDGFRVVTPGGWLKEED